MYINRLSREDFMLDSHDIDPTDSAYSQQGPLAGLEPIAQATEELLSGGCSLTNNSPVIHLS